MTGLWGDMAQEWCWSADPSELLVALDSTSRVVLVGSAVVSCVAGAAECGGFALVVGGAPIDAHGSKTLGACTLVARVAEP